MLSKYLKNGARRLLEAANLAVTKLDHYRYLNNRLHAQEENEKCFRQITGSHAQLFQDMFVLETLGYKRNGFFVEFGATNGITLSNTYLLESKYGWRGILAEPARCWRDDLVRNRIASKDFRCVSDVTGAQVMFAECAMAELSTTHALIDKDINASLRLSGDVKNYAVETVTLNDLLQQHAAPSEIDFMSVDTEGSEYSILSGFDFDKHSVDIICCEHNFTANREKILSLLDKVGYERMDVRLSKFDDWYVKRGL